MDLPRFRESIDLDQDSLGPAFTGRSFCPGMKNRVLKNSFHNKKI